MVDTSMRRWRVPPIALCRVSETLRQGRSARLGGEPSFEESMMMSRLYHGTPAMGLLFFGAWIENTAAQTASVAWALIGLAVIGAGAFRIRQIAKATRLA